MPRVLGSAPSREKIIEVIERFYCGTRYILNDDGTLTRVSDGFTPRSVAVVRKGPRFQFVALDT